MGRMLVFTGPSSPDREAEYNKWYDEVHLPEVCGIGPFVSAERFKVSAAQIYGTPDHAYAAIYTFVGDPQGAVDALMSASGRFTMSDAMDTAMAKVIVLDEPCSRHEAPA